MTDSTLAQDLVQFIAFLLFIVSTIVTMYWAVFRMLGIPTPWLDRAMAWMGSGIQWTLTALVAMVILCAVKIGSWILPRK